MSLGDHFRELRARLMRSLLVLTIGIVVAFAFYEPLYELVLAPYNSARDKLDAGVVSEPVITGVGTPLLFQLKLCGIAAVVGTSPWWLAELWGFIVPALHAHERKWPAAPKCPTAPI